MTAADKFQDTQMFKSVCPPRPITERVKDRLRPHWKNFKYLTCHKWHVFRAGLALRVPIWRLIVHDWSKLTLIEWFAYSAYFFDKKPGEWNMHESGNAAVCESRLITAGEKNANDDVFPKEVLEAVKEKPKKIVVEHGRERQYDKPTAEELEAEEKLRERFDRAWLHHIHLNPHHWEYWVLRQSVGEIKCLKMPAHFAREMVADWIGAGVAQGKTGRRSVLDWYLGNKDKIQLHPRTRELVEALIKVYVNT